MPSLTQCYKYNQLSCCVAGHDAVIKEGKWANKLEECDTSHMLTLCWVVFAAYDALWSTTCVREYANLEVLFCLGCNDLQVHC